MTHTAGQFIVSEHYFGFQASNFKKLIPINIVEQIQFNDKRQIIKIEKMYYD